ncbi:MAG: TRAP transporter fused permease subunit [Chloroflexi bacterium]|nr:TRAP transporter fused permease subunit [Chloroflexota bacterium]
MIELSETAKFRTLRGPLRTVEQTMLVGLPLVAIVFLLDVPSYLRLSFYQEQYLGFFLAICLALVFLSVPAGPRAARDHAPWYDLLLAGLGVCVGGYLLLFYPQLIGQLGERTPLKVGLSVAAIGLLLEASRRLMGWSLVLIAGFFLLYAHFAYLFPDPFYDRGASIERLTTYLYFDANGIAGLPLSVAATTVLAFIFFGEALHAAGGGKFITDFAMLAMGRYRGGPAKMSVVSSSLFGTISGSAVANVVVDGVINIPLMKKTGYAPHVGAAIEAVASTGGQIMPPVMGAAAFLIAEFLAIPYSRVAAAALLPATLFYVALFVQIDLEAAKQGLRGVPAHELPRLRSVLHTAPLFVIPLVVLVVTLFVLYWQAEKAALAAVLAIIAVSLPDREHRLLGRKFLAVLASTGRALLDIGVVTALAGIVIGVISLTGLGFTLAFSLVQVGGSSVLLLLVLSALVSIILGMGMPTTAVYILLAVLVAPTLVQLGIVPLAAHLFIFYFGMLSMITPPVCLASFAAASLAGADPMRTGYAGMRLALLAYVVPFVFVFSPRLLLQGSVVEVVATAGMAIGGSVLLGGALVGYLFRPLSWPRRLVLALAAVGLLLSTTDQLGEVLPWVSAALGLGMSVPLLFWEWRQGARPRPTVYPPLLAEKAAE